MRAQLAQEVVKAAISFCKVGLSALPSDAVAPLLSRLVPSLLVWCTNKHPHLKTQARRDAAPRAPRARRRLSRKRTVPFH